MAVKFGAGDDRRGAYIAGSSGARRSGPLDVATGVADAFLAGLESNRDRFKEIGLKNLTTLFMKKEG